LSLSGLSMARLGLLCINGGKLHGQPDAQNGKAQVISPQWIAQMWKPYSDAQSPQGKNQPKDYQLARYGYQWWIRSNSDIQLYCAEGLGGQMICCIPKLKAVIVTSTDTRRAPRLWPLLEHHWIPALMQTA